MHTAMIRAAAVGLSALLGVACGGYRAPTRVSTEWRDASHVDPPMRKIVVHAENVTPATRHDVEDRFAAELTKRGVVAVPSYQVLGETLLPPSEGRAVLQAHGYNGALVIRVGLGETRTYQTSRPTGYWQLGPSTSREVVTETRVTSHAALWDLDDQKAIWTATADTRDARTGDSVARGLVKALVPALEDEGVVSTQSR